MAMREIVGHIIGRIAAGAAKQTVHAQLNEAVLVYIREMAMIICEGNIHNNVYSNQGEAA